MGLSNSPSQSPPLPKRKRITPPPNPDREPLADGNHRLGRYLLTGQLGRGGMGIVYEAEDTLLKRKVAIKLLPKEVSANPDALARFLREAQGAARLNHVNVVAVYDIGETNGIHYIVMELIKGGQDILRLRGPFHWREATSILLDVCRGVAAAHKAGLIHRDIKPANILRSTDGVVKLADFGLVKPAGVKGAVVTALGEVVGTPHYMSPEQSRCAVLDERSDIYSLGATYFALLTGKPPFNSPDSMQVLFAHCAHPVPDPRETVRDLPELCTAIIHKAMAKDRAQRQRNANELLAELEQVLVLKPGKPSAADTDAKLPPLVWKKGNAEETTHSFSLPEAHLGERTEATSASKSRRWKWISFGILSLLVLVILVVVFFNNRKKNPAINSQPERSSDAKDDWPSRATEADKAIRTRDASAMKSVLEKIQVLQKREQGREPAEQEAIRQTLGRLGKALAFRESITEKGLVLGLDGQVTSVRFSPDDNWLAVGQTLGGSGALVLDTHTGEKRHTLWPRKGNVSVRVQALAFDRDSAFLAAATTDNRIKLMHLASGKESSFDLGPRVNRALSVVFSPSSPTLLAGLEPIGEGKGKPYLKIWNIDSRREPFLFKVEHSAKISSVDYCAGGLQLASGSHDKRVILWNAETGQVWRELHTEFTIRSIACDPQGRTLAVVGQNQETHSLQIWDYAAQEILETKPSPHGACHCVAYSRNGKLLACGSGSRILLFDTETRMLLTTLAGHSQDVTSLAFSAEGGILATGSMDQTMRLWDVSKYLPSRPEP